MRRVDSNNLLESYILENIIKEKIDLFERILVENFLFLLEANTEESIKMMEMYIDNFYTLCNVPNYGNVTAESILHKAYVAKFEEIKINNKGSN